MSITLPSPIANRPEALVHLRPLVASDPIGRTLFVTREMYASLTPTEDDHEGEGKQLPELRSFLERFVRGDDIVVNNSFQNNTKDCYIARLRDEVSVEWNFWDLRCVAPKPGIRVICAFLETDTLVALEWEYRKALKDASSEEWEAFINKAKDTWERLYPEQKPLKGSRTSDYISKRFTELQPK